MEDPQWWGRIFRDIKLSSTTTCSNILSSIMINVKIIWSYPPFEPPPFNICDQEERIKHNEEI
jgi:hypothetical protein